MNRLKTRESVEYLEYLRARDLQESAHLQEQDQLLLEEDKEDGQALVSEEPNVLGKTRLFGSKEKEIKVGIASVLELKAELSKKEAQAAQSQLGIQEKVDIIPTATRFKGMAPMEKLVAIPVSGKQEGAVRNKGIEERNQRDLSHPNHDEQSKLEASWVALQRKAKLYEQLQEDGGLGRDQEDEDLLVDFLSKSMHERNGGLDAMRKDKHSSSTQRRDHLAPVGPSKKGEWVQITDEFGRDRLVRAEEADKIRTSVQLAAHYQDTRQDFYIPQRETDFDGGYSDGDEKDGMKPPHSDYQKPVYPPPRETNPTLGYAKHFDSSREKRNLGVGFYQFAVGDDQKRQQQMQDINQLREETLESRARADVQKLKRKTKNEARTKMLADRAKKRKVQEAEKTAESFLGSLLAQDK